MTKKRFTVMQTGLNGNFIKDNGNIILIEDVVNLLNDLSDENEQLKQQLVELRKENYGNLDGLTYKDEVEIPRLSERISDLECENEQLKQYKQAVSDVLINWSQKNITAKQLQVIIAIMKELGVEMND